MKTWQAGRFLHGTGSMLCFFLPLRGLFEIAGIIPAK